MKQRVATMLMLLPPVLLCLLASSPWPLFALVSVVLVLASRELAKLVGDRSYWILAWGAPAFLLLAGWLTGVRSLSRLELGGFLWICQGLTFVGVSAAFLWARKRDARYLPIGLWLAAPLASVVALHGLKPSDDPFWYPNTPVLLIALPIWCGDTAAYLVGRRFGKRPLAPAISPNKTVEGAVGNLAVALLVAAGVGTAIGLPLTPSMLAGLVAGTLGQAGDLFESWVKRTAGRKDSGTLLPGHGGFLDRIDSALLTAPTVALIVDAWLPHR
ncbi:MAG: phosphatidate cytidylyltransferase [Fimbriimonadaceae bacterium]|nr:phosphatidate cytidylyltransferase [Fimbriimonadaceae bacterium]